MAWLKSLLVFAALSLVDASTAQAQPGASPIILITMEGVRADRAGFLGSKAKLTPSLDKLATQSTVFERAYAQSPIMIESAAGVLTGSYPQTHRVTGLNGTLERAVPYLPQLMSAGGYKTTAYVGSGLLDPKRGYAEGFERGFEHYLAPPSSASDGLRTFAGAIKKKPTKGFIWINIPLPDWSTTAAYDRVIARMDANVGQIFERLRESDLFDASAIVVVSLQGESLQAHGEARSGVFLYEETMHVPLLVKLPGNRVGGKRVSAKVALVDVAPTLFELAGLAVPPAMQGHSLLKAGITTGDQPIYSRSDFPQYAFGWSPLESWRAGKYVYIKAPHPELYDLSSDPTAQNNLTPNGRAIADTMASQLEAFDRRMADPNSKSGTQLNSSELQKLASLGYVGLQKSVNVVPQTGIDPKDQVAIIRATEAAAYALSAGQFERSIASLNGLEDLGRHSYLAQYLLASAYIRQLKFAKAIECLHRAIELQPNSALAHYWMGYSLLKTSEVNAAIVHLEIAAARMPSFTQAHSTLAEAYERAGHVGEAQQQSKAGSALKNKVSQ